MVAALLLAILLDDPPKSMSGHTGVQIGDKVYVTGGMGLVNTGAFFADLWEVDPPRNRWRAVSKMREARGMAAAAAIDGSIYVAGGFPFSGAHLRSVERYDTKTGTWTNVAPMIDARSRFPLVALGGRLYAVSGMRGASSGELNTPLVERYDPKLDTWRPAGSLRHARHGFAAIAWKGRIYVFGGNDESSATSAECWDPTTGTSTELPPMTFRRGFHGVVAEGGKLVNFGGRPAGEHPSAYDPESNTWTDLPGPDLELNRFVYGVIGGKVWTVGGESLTDKFPIVQSFKPTKSP